MKAKNITAKQFAEEIGIQPSGMSHILSGRNNPSLDFVMKVVRRWPEVSITWLMLGKGEMYDSPDENKVTNVAAQSPEDTPQETLNTEYDLFSQPSIEEEASPVSFSGNHELELHSQHVGKQPDVPIPQETVHITPDHLQSFDNRTVVEETHSVEPTETQNIKNCVKNALPVGSAVQAAVAKKKNINIITKTPIKK